MNYLLGKMMQWLGFPGFVKPFVYRDESGSVISVRTSPRYTTLTIDGKEYFFIRETGKFDGIGAMSPDIVGLAKSCQDIVKKTGHAGRQESPQH